MKYSFCQQFAMTLNCYLSLQLMFVMTVTVQVTRIYWIGRCFSYILWRRATVLQIKLYADDADKCLALAKIMKY